MQHAAPADAKPPKYHLDNRVSLMISAQNKIKNDM